TGNQARHACTCTDAAPPAELVLFYSGALTKPRAGRPGVRSPSAVSGIEAVRHGWEETHGGRTRTDRLACVSDEEGPGGGRLSDSPLFRAVSRGNVAKVRSALAEGADPNAPDDQSLLDGAKRRRCVSRLWGSQAGTRRCTSSPSLVP